MSKYVILEVVNGDGFETVLNAENVQDAIKAADSTWERLTEHDKKRREQFYLVLCDVNNNIVDYDNIQEVIKEYI